MRWYIGWDQKDALAFEVAARSLKKHASIPVEVIALKDWQLRARGVFWREYYVNPRGQMFDLRDDRPFSTNFTYTRFCVPALENYGDEPVGFCDADMLFRADVAELLAAFEHGAVACVKHRHEPPETVKMTGVIQRRYQRKNWSSVMLLRPSACTALTPYRVNQGHRDWLHGLRWVDDRDIVGLDEAWNWLEGHSDPEIEPRIVHFTRGTPDMPGYENVAYADEWRAIRDELKAGDASA